MILNLGQNYNAGKNKQYSKVINVDDFYIVENDLEVSFIVMANTIFFAFYLKKSLN